MIRRTNEEIKENLIAEYAAMHEAKCNSLTISRALNIKYNPRLIIEAVQEYNDNINSDLHKILVFSGKKAHN